jgi:hypothetical protein
VSRNSLKFVIGLSQQTRNLAESWLRSFFSFPFAQGIAHVREFSVPVTVSLPIGIYSSHLHVHDPEELTFVEQNPITTGGPGDFMQTAFPTRVDPETSDVLSCVIGGLLLLS